MEAEKKVSEKKINCIMLVDDDLSDNWLHETEIKHTNLANTIITKNRAMEALDYLKENNDKDKQPDLIFLDINMPRMNGWEFLEKFNALDKEIKGRIKIIMLTTSNDSREVERSKKWPFVYDYITKPLTSDLMFDVANKYFK